MKGHGKYKESIAHIILMKRLIGFVESPYHSGSIDQIKHKLRFWNKNSPDCKHGKHEYGKCRYTIFNLLILKFYCSENIVIFVLHHTEFSRIWRYINLTCN